MQITINSSTAWAIVALVAFILTLNAIMARRVKKTANAQYYNLPNSTHTVSTLKFATPPKDKYDKRKGVRRVLHKSKKIGKKS